MSIGSHGKNTENKTGGYEGKKSKLDEILNQKVTLETDMMDFLYDGPMSQHRNGPNLRMI